jgi:hypothetical protein
MPLFPSRTDQTDASYVGLHAHGSDGARAGMPWIRGLGQCSAMHPELGTARSPLSCGR